ncbi:hypothetical protein CHS0354_031350 [Potamilus streckersoni]|uniref:Uncharacterized protein n=1 Tax=Potamilus streckersoni TaxID=2493646 RepID=A0AAE0SKA6_9BIVA|nr:hypothetical protein CHS0354_031350 [Potamilus streckersoni]
MLVADGQFGNLNILYTTVKGDQNLGHLKDDLPCRDDFSHAEHPKWIDESAFWSVKPCQIGEPKGLRIKLSK